MAAIPTVPAPVATDVPRRPVQVDASHYREAYMTLPRLLACWHQAKTVSACRGQRVLEVGPGPGLTTWLLRRWGFDVVTVDIDPALRPTFTADIVRLPFGDGAFDSVLAAEVLEHLPFAQFQPALRELGRVVRGHLVITIPYRTIGIAAGVNVPLLEPRFVTVGWPWRRRHRFDGQHYWEMGRPGYGRRAVRSAIRAAGLHIVREFRSPLSLFCYGFVLAGHG
ncbi:MAG: class I SAM-dependent methyltransferase [Phycisphaerae bacterium]